MSGSSERKRSQTKYLQESARMAALTEQLQQQHVHEDFQLYSEQHTRAVITAYGNLIQLGHQVNEIDPNGKLKDDVYDILKQEYDEDFYWLAWYDRVGRHQNPPAESMSTRVHRTAFEAWQDSAPIAEEDVALQSRQLALRNGDSAALHTWFPQDDDESGDESLLGESPDILQSPKPTAAPQVDKREIKKKILEHIAQPGGDTVAALTKLVMLKELEGGASKDHRDLPKTLPTTLEESYDFETAKISITDHFELLDDFLFDQPADRQVKFLLTSLTGRSRKKFRKWWKRDTNMDYTKAKSWCILQFTVKEERATLAAQLQNIKMQSGESVESLVQRAIELKLKLNTMGVHEDNFHLRQYLERAITSGASNVMERIRCKTKWQSWTLEKFIEKATTIDKAINPPKSALFMATESTPQTVLAAQATGKRRKRSDATMEEFTPEQMAKIHSFADKKRHKALVAAGVDTKKKFKGKRPFKKKTGKPNGEDARREESALPGHANESKMAEFYSEDEWKKRCALGKSDTITKDQVNEHWRLFHKDRWDGKYVCFRCMKTGHTINRCKSV
jgi:hypothetical protein